MRPIDEHSTLAAPRQRGPAGVASRSAARGRASTHPRFGALVAAALVGAALLPDVAGAQLVPNLPQNDFIWNWGNPERSRGFGDFSINGGEDRFRCSLTGKLSAGSRLTTRQVREMEIDLGSSLYFIQTATNTMNTLERRRDLDWATLDCALPEESESSDAEREAREEEARQRAVERMLERREREQRRAN